VEVKSPFKIGNCAILTRIPEAVGFSQAFLRTVSGETASIEEISRRAFFKRKRFPSGLEVG